MDERALQQEIEADWNGLMGSDFVFLDSWTKLPEGIPDMLAAHRPSGSLVVIELKNRRTGRNVITKQLSRYLRVAYHS